MTEESLMAAESTETVESTETTETTTESTEAAKFDYVMDKYRAEGRTEQEALEMQAKSYPDLNSKFGAFTGAPDDYEISLTEEVSEKGYTINPDDPLAVALKDLCKEGNVNQDFFNKLIDLHIGEKTSEGEQSQQQHADEIKALGDNATSRLKNLSDWGSANMDQDMFGKFEGLVTSADSVEIYEFFVSKLMGAPVNATAQVATGVTAEEVSAMQFAKDDHGNRLINTSKEARAKYQKARDLLHGTQDHNIVMGN